MPALAGRVAANGGSSGGVGILTRDGATALGQACLGTRGRAIVAPVAFAGEATIMCASVYLITGHGMDHGNLDILACLAGALSTRPGPYNVGADMQCSPETVREAGVGELLQGGRGSPRKCGHMS